MPEFGINLADVKRYLGYQNHPIDPQTEDDIAQSVAYLQELALPKMAYQVFPIQVTTSGIALEGSTLVFTGEDAHKLLSKSHHCILLAVTLGQALDRHLRMLQLQDMSKAVILDACASSYVEEACNHWEEVIKQELGSPHFTDRFSPGYGDMPLSLQPLFCQVLQTSKKIGLSADKSHILTPKKSITAVIGIADTPQPMRIKGCGSCALRNNCNYRKGGHTCAT